MEIPEGRPEAIDIDDFIGSIGPNLIRECSNYWHATSDLVVEYPHNASRVYAEIEDRSFWFSHRNRCIVTIVRQFPPNGPLLDVGGGNGIVSLALAAAGFIAIVMEPGEGIALARTRGLPAIRAALTSAHLREHSVPAVGLFDVLEHINDDLEALVELRRILQPQGRLYISVPAHQYLWSAADEMACHARRYSIAGLCNRLSDAGFQVDFATFAFAPLVLPVFVLRTLPWRLGVRHPSRSVEREHAMPAGLIGTVLRRWLDAEHSTIARSDRVGFGSSILAAAHVSP